MYCTRDRESVSGLLVLSATLNSERRKSVDVVFAWVSSVAGKLTGKVESKKS